MNLLKPSSRKLRGIALMAVSSVILSETPYPAVGRQSSQPTKPSHAPAYTDQDAYQIYAILLESEKHSQYVIQAEIDGYSDLTRKKLGIEGDKKFMREWGPVMDDYAKQNRTGKLLQKEDFPPQAAYELVPGSRIFPAATGQEGWDDYYRRYPGSGGFYAFSAVGFNPTRTRALVDMGHHCGMLCGYGGPHFFEKKNGKWHEVQPKATTTMWAS
jgi:hypothetical protein